MQVKKLKLSPLLVQGVRNLAWVVLLGIAACSNPVGTVWKKVPFDQRYLYVPNNGSQFGSGTTMTGDSVSAFSIDPNGTLEVVPGSPFTTGGTNSGPYSAIVSPNGKFVYIANNNGSGIAAFSIGPKGTLTPVAGSPFAAGSGPFSLDFTPDGQFLYVVEIGSNDIWAYSVSNNGALGFLNSTIVAGGGLDLEGSAISSSSNGSFLYAAALLVGIYAYAVSPTGALNVVPGSPFTTLGGGTYTIAASPNGAFLYTADGGNSISAFSIASDGSLTELSGLGSPYSDALGPIGITVSPNGAYLYAADNGPGSSGVGTTVSAYSIGSNGALSAIAGSPFLAGTGPVSVVESSDNRYLYVTNNKSNSVSGYLITSTGALVAVPGSQFASGSYPVGLAVTP